MDTVADACILGDADMVAPLYRAGVRCTVVTSPDDAVRHSRRAHYLGWRNPWHEPEALLRLLHTYAAGQSSPPVLYFQSDEATLFVSRHRSRLADSFRFAIADPCTIEDLVDKFRFRALADRLDLPVPPSALIDPGTGPVLDPQLQFPVVVKPATRGDSRWIGLEADQKAIHVPDQQRLDALWPSFEAYGEPLLVQQMITGPETAVESYHCYVDGTGDLVADFTGRKLRTRPAVFGHTTALTITDQEDVRELGRHIVRSVGLTGVAKCDFKRGPDGRLWLLEINPRFSLWLHPGAIAGVNLPALVHADMVGGPRHPVRTATPGVSWLRLADLQAAREGGLSLRQWARFARRCEGSFYLDWSDPLPLLHLVGGEIRKGLAKRRPYRSDSDPRHPGAHRCA